MKNIIGKVIKAVGEETVKIAVNDASTWIMHQEEEPQVVRERFVKNEEE
ncbi:MAG: cyclic lactone autoinducer peptide [Lachnospiraceae bacterium]|nr:cyclic lactone autoinducer peptide [Lachnospiraceae bacterium]